MWDTANWFHNSTQGYAMWKRTKRVFLKNIIVDPRSNTLKISTPDASISNNGGLEILWSRVQTFV